MLDGPHTNPKRITCSEGKPVDCNILTKALTGRERNWRLNPQAFVEAANQKVEILYFAIGQLFKDIIFHLSHHRHYFILKSLPKVWVLSQEHQSVGCCHLDSFHTCDKKGAQLVKHLVVFSVVKF